MNGHSGQLLAALGVAVVTVLISNNLLTLVASSSGFSNSGYIIQSAMVALVVAYAIYVKYEIYVARQRLALLEHAWRKMLCGIAVFRKNKLLEVRGDKGMFQMYGFVARQSEHNDQESQIRPESLSRTEEYLKQDGNRGFAYRQVIPLNDFNTGSYVIEQLTDISEQMKRDFQRETEYVRMIKVLVNMFEIKDPYSHGHSEVVSNLAQELAKVLHLTSQDIDTIGRAALLHDIGKIVIPVDVFNKAGELSAKEIEKVQEHPIVGADILASMETFREVAVIVRHHHERFDGAGYPARLVGDAIPLGSRIIAVADTFDAITVGRLARSRQDVRTTLAIIQEERGHQFDPVIVDAFVNMVNEQRRKKSEGLQF